MNVSIFKSIMKPLLESNTVKNRAVFADIMATAYSVSTVGYAGTSYGAQLVQGDKSFLQKCINDALDANFSDDTRSVNQTAYKLMAFGFMGYWASAKFTPLFPVEKMDAVVKPTKISSPGNVGGLGANLFYAFVMGNADAHLNALTTSLLLFQRTISGNIVGTKSGATVTFPWTGII